MNPARFIVTVLATAAYVSLWWMLAVLRHDAPVEVWFYGGLVLMGSTLGIIGAVLWWIVKHWEDKP
jgi:hypothetical protein